MALQLREEETKKRRFVVVVTFVAAVLDRSIPIPMTPTPYLNTPIKARAQQLQYRGAGEGEHALLAASATTIRGRRAAGRMACQFFNELGTRVVACSAVRCYCYPEEREEEKCVLTVNQINGLSYQAHIDRVRRLFDSESN